MQTRLLLLLLLCVSACIPPAQACLNDFEVNEQEIAAHHQEVKNGARLVHALTHHQLAEPWDKVRDRLAERVAYSPTFEERNDYAVALCHTGEPARASELLLEIEKERPGAYRTATNLGTAHELAGNNQEALHWITEGIRRNPESHEGSEWIHVAILKAKIAEATQPGWLKGHSILGLDFAGGKPQRSSLLTLPDAMEQMDLLSDIYVPPMTSRFLPTGNSGEALTLVQIRDGLQHQLHERIQFTPPPNLLVAKLIFDYAEMVNLTDSREHATKLYKLANDYGFAAGSAAYGKLIKSRIEWEPKHYPPRTYLFGLNKRQMTFLGALAALSILAAATIWLIIRFTLKAMRTRKAAASER